MNIPNSHHSSSSTHKLNQTQQLTSLLTQSNTLSLQLFNTQCEADPSISSLTCAHFINKIEGLTNKEVRFGGSGKESLLNSLSFILMALGCKQVKFYPHLITLIREHFFKPQLFSHYDAPKRNRILNICGNIEIELISSGGVGQFFENNEEFLLAFQYVLSQIVQTFGQSNKTSEIIQSVRKRFNIDSIQIEIPNSKASAWILGMQQKFYLIEQDSTYIIVSSSTSTQPSRSMIQSTHQNKFESQKQQSEGGYQMIIQASQESTPKFKDNQQSIQYRKKSHKNSFGGDFQVAGYKQLNNIVNKSHHDRDKDCQQAQRKVFSLKYEFNEMGALQSESQIITQKEPNEEDQIHITKNESKPSKYNAFMRSSNIDGRRFQKEDKTKEEKGERKKHITTSEIFKVKNQTSICTSLKQGGQNNNKESSKASIKQVRNESDNPESIENRTNVFSHPFNVFKSKQGLQSGFMNNEMKRFIFKEIESEYNDNELSVESELEYPKQAPLICKHQSAGQPLRSSLTQLKNSNNSGLGLLYQGHCFRKNERNRRSLLLQSTVNPIQEQTLSSQREKTEEHSVSQSNKEVENSSHHQQIERKSTNSHQIDNKAEDRNESSKFEAYSNSNNKFFFNNINNNKNRKFSYLTQPISASKNSINGGKQQSNFEEGNETIPESPSCLEGSMHNPKHFLNSRSKNKVGKSPKIHKNSEAILTSKSNRRRFEENPLSFSQIIANVHQDSNISAYGHTSRNKAMARLGLSSNVIQFCKQNYFCYKEPQGWDQKETIYHFFDGRKSERFISNKTIVNKAQGQSSPNKISPPESPCSLPDHTYSNTIPLQKIQLNQQKIPLANLPSHNPNIQTHQNIRSTLDSSVTNPHPSLSNQNLKTPLVTINPEDQKGKLHFLSFINKDKKIHRSNKRIRNNSIEYISISQRKNELLNKKESPKKSNKSPLKSHGNQSPAPFALASTLKYQSALTQNFGKQVLQKTDPLPSYLSLNDLRSKSPARSRQKSPAKQRQRKYTQVYSPPHRNSLAPNSTHNTIAHQHKPSCSYSPEHQTHLVYPVQLNHQSASLNTNVVNFAGIQSKTIGGCSSMQKALFSGVQIYPTQYSNQIYQSEHRSNF